MLKPWVASILLIHLLALTSFTHAQLRIDLKNSSTLNLDIISRITAAVAERENYQPFTEHSGNRVQAIMRNLSRSEPQASFGDACLQGEWLSYIQPIILSTLRGDSAKVDKAYRTLAIRVIDEDERVLHRLCLSNTYGLQCGKSDQCECLTTPGIEIVQCTAGCQSLCMEFWLICLSVSVVILNFGSVKTYL